jgi:hypothetical protein
MPDAFSMPQAFGASAQRVGVGGLSTGGVTFGQAAVSSFGGGAFGGGAVAQAQPGQGTAAVKWAKTTGIDCAGSNDSQHMGVYISITHMEPNCLQQYQNYSFEELRVQDYQALRKRADPKTLASSIATALQALDRAS